MASGSSVVHIEHVDDLIARCRQWLVSSNNPMELATALALVTGRRPVEILQEAIFTPDGSTDNYRVMFKGQVKKGLNDINSLDPADDGVPAFRIPVLAPRYNVIRALQRLRQLEDTSQLTHIQVNNKYAGKLNDFVKAVIHPGLVFKDLRALYLELTFELCKPHSYGKNDFGQRVLGHDAVYMSTHYTRIQVSGLTQRYRRQGGLQFVL